ncbi:TPA: hypothetical protein K8M77_000341 [Clostridium perfringens]|nr:hypothetical protein [Clostridium perfringens]
MVRLELKSIENYCIQQQKRIAELKVIIQNKDKEIERLTKLLKDKERDR